MRTLTKDEVNSILYEHSLVVSYSDKYRISPNINAINRIKNLLSGKRLYTYRNNGSKVLLVYPHDYFRKNHFLLFDHFSKCFSELDSFYYSVKVDGTRKRRLIDFFWLCHSLIINKRKLSLENLCIMSYFPVFYEQWKDIDLEKYKLVVLYNELSPLSAYIINQCKKCGIKTATLQHGEMGMVFGDDSPENKSRELTLKYSISDYFFAWNKYTYNTAVRLGMNAQKLIIAGMPGYVNKKCDGTVTNNRKICIILSGSKDLNEDNINMIDIVKKYAKKNQMNYSFRYHPNSVGDEYDNFIDDNYCGNANAESVELLVSQYECFICCATSMFIEFLLYGAKVCRYKSRLDIYTDYDGTFEDVNSLDYCLENYDEIRNDLKDLYPPENSYEIFRDFFSNFI